MGPGTSARWQRSLDAAQRFPDDDLRRSSLARCAEAMRLFVDADGAAVLLAAAAPQMTVAAVRGLAPEELELEGSVDSAFARGLQPGEVSFYDASQLPATDPLRVGDRGQVAACALSVDGRPLATAVFWTRASGWSLRRHRRIRKLAAFVAPEVERARLDDDERRSRLGAFHARRHLALVVDASAALAQALGDWAPAVHVLADKIVPNHADFMAIDLIGPDGVVERQVSAHIDTALGEVAR